MPDNTGMFDPLITHPGRLSILTALSAEVEIEFVRLRRETNLTDGNLVCHARKLESSGLISIEKARRSGRAVTIYHLTRQGRERLRNHVEQLTRSVRAPAAPAFAGTSSDDWVD